jgi:hypothetical protein
MKAMDLRPRKLPVEANDSDGLEAEEIASQSRGQQRTWGQQNLQLKSMKAMGLRPRKSPVEANDSNWLEVKEIVRWDDSDGLEAEGIAHQGWWQWWSWGKGNCLSRPMTAMGLTPRKLPIKADDSYGLEAKGITRLDWWQLWAWGRGNCTVKANDSYGLEAKGIACQGRWQLWAQGQGNCPLRLMTTMLWAWGWGNHLFRPRTAMGCTLMKLTIGVGNGDEPKVGNINAWCWQYGNEPKVGEIDAWHGQCWWSRSWQNWQWISKTAMGPKSTNSTMKVKMEMSLKT